MRPLAIFSLLLLAACGSEPAPPQTPIVAFRFECAPDTPGSIVQVLEDGFTASFGPLEVFEFDYVGPMMDRNGKPAIAFTIAAHQKERFADLTEAHVGKRLAIYLDGALRSAPEINERLPGQGIINGGQQGFTEAEFQDLMERIRAQESSR